jgi:hypothetical protein
MFQARVLTPSLDSINTSTDLKVSYETWRTGRGIGGLLFHIQRSSKPAPVFRPDQDADVSLSVPPAEVLPLPPSRLTRRTAPLIERLVQQHHLREADALHAVQTHGVEGVREILGYVRQEVGQRKGTPEEIRNVSAYLARCFRDGYGRKGEIEREAERRSGGAPGQPRSKRPSGSQVKHPRKPPRKREEPRSRRGLPRCRPPNKWRWNRPSFKPNPSGPGARLTVRSVPKPFSAGWRNRGLEGSKVVARLYTVRTLGAASLANRGYPWFRQQRPLKPSRRRRSRNGSR